MVTLSSAEAEYVAGSKAAQEAVYLRQLLRDLDYEQLFPSTLFEDNQGAICIAKNPVSRDRTRHIDIRVHDLRQRVEDSTIELTYCKTTEMLADIFTKSLPAPTHQRLCESLFKMDAE
jgi:hypothetical protein